MRSKVRGFYGIFIAGASHSSQRGVPVLMSSDAPTNTKWISKFTRAPLLCKRHRLVPPPPPCRTKLERKKNGASYACGRVVTWKPPGEENQKKKKIPIRGYWQMCSLNGPVHRISFGILSDRRENGKAANQSIQGARRIFDSSLRNISIQYVTKPMDVTVRLPYLDSGLPEWIRKWKSWNEKLIKVWHFFALSLQLNLVQ
jgi:hypothetical protein